MLPHTLFIIIFIVFTADFIFERLMSWLNIKASRSPLPPEVSDIYDNEKYMRQQQYFRTNSRFGIVSAIFSFSVMAFMLLFDGFAYIDTVVNGFKLPDVLVSILFFGVLYVANDLITLPFDVYDTFVIEQRFGFNKTTPLTFILDRIKGYLLTVFIGFGLLWAIITIYNATPQYFWILAWGVVSVIQLFISVFYSNLIVPLFNKQTPLASGELRDKIEDFAQKVDFPIKNIYTIDGSRRSTKANAYFSGMFGKKRIVLYDTLIETLTTDEIVAVLAHEIGHYKHKHTLKSVIITLSSNLLLFWLLGIILDNDTFAEAIGVHTGASFHINILVFAILYTPISLILDILSNVLSRRFEYQADDFAKKNGLAAQLISALKKLSANSLSNLTPHNLVVFVGYSHPTLYRRILNLTTRQKN